MNPNTAFDSLNAIDLFSCTNNQENDKFPFKRETLLFHIPHSSTYIPFSDEFVSTKILNDEINKSTDWFTDDIFDVPNTSKLIAPFSRVFCDVERLSDDEELLSKYGRGFYYTHTQNGDLLRNENISVKNRVHGYYLNYHNAFKNLVNNILLNDNGVTIIDCHSFSNEPSHCDLDKTTNRPDICIGTDNYHTSQVLINFFVKKFNNYGYSVKINTPYSGTIVPLSFLNKNEDVQSIMIEINRNLYIDNNGIILYDNVSKLKRIVNEIFMF